MNKLNYFFAQKDNQVPRIKREGPPKPYTVIKTFSFNDHYLWAGRKQSGFTLFQLTLPDGSQLSKTFTCDVLDFDAEFNIAKRLIQRGG